VVSDAGPIIHLAQINKLCLLKRLFQTVLISERVKFEVFDEGARLRCPDAEEIMAALKQGWIRVEPLPVLLIDRILHLAKGENISNSDAEILLLAQDRQAILLVDDKVLSNLARMFGLRVLNTWTILLESLRKNSIELNEVENAVMELGAKKHKLKDQDAVRILEIARKIADSSKK
jgi:predicted nucleic acid-binding protein